MYLGNNYSKLLKKIFSFRYPFYENQIASIDELKQIHLIAEKTYITNSNSSNVFDFEILKKLYYQNPSFWLIIKKKKRIIGFIHTEIVPKKIYEELIKGHLNENDFNSDELVNYNSFENKIIHIGSIIIDKNSQEYKLNDILYFVACLVDKILDIIIENNINEIFTVEYPDSTGISHFKNKLHKYGFKIVGQSKSKNYIFIFNLKENKNTFFYSLLEELVKIKKAYYKEDKNYLNRINSIFS